MDIVKNGAALGGEGGRDKTHFIAHGFDEGIEFSAYVASETGIDLLIDELRIQVLDR
jgi:hypothetical protein